MCELMRGHNAINAQEWAYLTEIHCYKILLLRMEHDAGIYNSRQIIFFGERRVAWQERKNWKLGA